VHHFNFFLHVADALVSHVFTPVTNGVIEYRGLLAVEAYIALTAGLAYLYRRPGS
jgi:hypothetical protein